MKCFKLYFGRELEGSHGPDDKAFQELTTDPLPKTIAIGKLNALKIRQRHLFPLVRRQQNNKRYQTCDVATQLPHVEGLKLVRRRMLIQGLQFDVIVRCLGLTGY